MLYAHDNLPCTFSEPREQNWRGRQFRITPAHNYGSPFISFLLVSYIGIPEATIATTYEGYDSVQQLENFENVTMSLYAHRGGDWPERQLRTLQTVLDLVDSYGFDIMTPGSEIVLLTDAPSHDLELLDWVINNATGRNVCISFYLSINGHSDYWEPYYKIAKETGGTIEESIDETAFLRFNEKHECGKCARFYNIPTVKDPSKFCNPPEIILDGRKKRLASHGTEQHCHYFTTSLLTTTLTVYGYTEEDVMIVTDPNRQETHVITNIMGEKIYWESFPVSGRWSVCVEAGTLTISVDTTDTVNSILQYITPLGIAQPPELSINYSPPPACT